MALWIIAAFVFLNIVTYLAFWIDKEAAQNRERRIPENNLLGLALIGGSTGALIAQQYLRHKTRKQPFRSYLISIGLTHIAAMTAFFCCLSRLICWVDLCLP